MNSKSVQFIIFHGSVNWCLITFFTGIFSSAMLHVRLPFTAIFVGLIVELAVSVSLIVLPITLVSGAVRPGTSSDTVSLAVGVIRTLVVSRICVCVLLVLLGCV